MLGWQVFYYGREKFKKTDICVDNFCLQLEHKRAGKVRIVEEQISDRIIEKVIIELMKRRG